MRKSRCVARPSAAGSQCRVQVHDVRPDRDVHRGREAEAPGRGEDAGVEVARPRPALREVAAQGRPEAEAVPVALDDRTVHLRARLARHPEAAAAEARGHVFRGAPGDRQLEVVHETRAVERDRRHEAALHEVDHDRREPDLQDVRPHAPDHRTPARARAQDLVPQREKRLAREQARQAGQEGRERAAAAVEPRRVPQVDLAAPLGERVGRDTLEPQRRGRRSCVASLATLRAISARRPPRRSARARGGPSRAPPGSAACRRCGTSIRLSTTAASGPPPLPVRPTVKRPRSRATRTPSSTFGERPEVLIASATSPGRPWASTCRAKTAAKPMSLPTAVTIDGSVVSAIAASARRSRARRPTSSEAKCCGVRRGAAVAEGERRGRRRAAAPPSAGRARAGAAPRPRRSAPSARRCRRRARGCRPGSWRAAIMLARPL